MIIGQPIPPLERSKLAMVRHEQLGGEWRVDKVYACRKDLITAERVCTLDMTGTQSFGIFSYPHMTIEVGVRYAKRPRLRIRELILGGR